jgi:hypothetical protein
VAGEFGRFEFGLHDVVDAQGEVVFSTASCFPPRPQRGTGAALRAGEIRNQNVRNLLRLLWFGLVDEAIAYLRSIPGQELKNAAARDALIEYLERNRRWIPCYAMRRQLGLPNSSNPAKRSNNLATSHRQKKNGMSWSAEGSQALTALSTIVCNNLTQVWVTEMEIPMTLTLAG